MVQASIHALIPSIFLLLEGADDDTIICPSSSCNFSRFADVSWDEVLSWGEGKSVLSSTNSPRKIFSETDEAKWLYGKSLPWTVADAAKLAVSTAGD